MNEEREVYVIGDPIRLAAWVDETIGKAVATGKAKVSPAAEKPPIKVQLGKGAPAWPAPAVPRKGAWIKEAGEIRYVIQSGDTVSGLAKTYLGQFERWKEIWHLQPDYMTRTADTIAVGEKFYMPDEAIATARKLGVLGPSMGMVAAVVGGVVVVVGGGTALYFALR